MSPSTLPPNEARKKTAETTARYTLRWVLAHDPPVVFEEASRQFVEAVREGTGGDVDVQLFTGDEFTAHRGGGRLSRTELIRCLAAGEIEMAHTYVSALGTVHQPLWAVELPFLFGDYAQAEQVLEGPAAARLMEQMVPHGMRGLCFAYSGGFRIIPSLGRPIRELSDFAGLRIRTSVNPIPGALFEKVGATGIPGPLWEIGDRAKAGAIDAAEITWVRFQYAELDRVFDTVNETSHSLFTTMMAINERFFQSLPEAYQDVIQAAGRAAGRLERRVSIQEEQRTRARCEAAGLDVVRMAPEQHQALREQALALYDDYRPILGEELIAAASS